jgi:hypothetical protein
MELLDLSDPSNIVAEFYDSVRYHTTVCGTIPQCAVPYHNLRYHTTEDIIVIVTHMRTLNLTFTILIIHIFNEAMGKCFL